MSCIGDLLDHVMAPREVELIFLNESGHFGRDRGSFLVASIFFILIFLAIAGFGVDISRYYLIRQETQRVAEGAALAGGQAFEQPTNSPDFSKVRQAIFDYVASKQGEDRLDLYTVDSPTSGQGFVIEPINPTGPTCGEELIPPEGATGCDAFPEGTYRVGVLAYNNFVPWFLPQEIFGERNYGVIESAIVEIRPQAEFGEFQNPLDCGVYSGGSINMPGQNFDASGMDFCGLGDFTSSSNNGEVGDINVPEGALVNEPEGSHGDINRFENSQPTPSFDSPPPGDYDVEISSGDFSSWSSCGMGGPGPASGRSLPGAEWTNDSDVCVEEDPSGSGYVIKQPGSTAEIQSTTGDPISIYSHTDITIENGGGLKGGLYSEGNIQVKRNNHDFHGEESVKGGLALWAEGNLDFDRNSNRVEGIMGADGDVNFNGTGGGGGPDVDGAIIGGSSFEMLSNTNNAVLTHDPSKYDSDYLSGTDWTSSSPYGQRNRNALYSDIQVNLIK